MYSLPYSSINMWSSENAGSILDFAGELELWTCAGKIKKAGGPSAAGHADRHVRAGGVGQPGTRRHGDQRTPQLMLGCRVGGRR